MEHQLIAVVDFGGKNNQLIARRVRENEVYCEVSPYTATAAQIAAKKPIGVMLIGDMDESTPYDSGLLGLGLPVLFAGKAAAAAESFAGVKTVLAPGEENTDAGKTAIREFLYKTCGAKGDWTMQAFADASIAEIKAQVGSGKVLLALSGGVDSAVCAALVSKAIGRQLTCVFVDHGLMRKNEGDDVEAAFKGAFDLNLIRAEEQDRFLSKLAGVTEPERKRKIIGTEFIRVFEEYARSIGEVDFLCQGTIYPDIIESPSGKSAGVKSHHNVGGMPDRMEFKGLIEPVRMLFKDEVRALGALLGLPEKFVRRQPFPGPGLGVRVVGEITREKLAIVREADAIFREEVENFGLSGEINQYFAFITTTPSVGVTEGERTFGFAVGLRAVKTVDFMTAEWVKLPYPLLEKVSSRICTEVKGVNRLVYDITSKPPATIEWE